MKTTRGQPCVDGTTSEQPRTSCKHFLDFLPSRRHFPCDTTSHRLRMSWVPVILPRSAWEVWLDPEVGTDGLAKLLKPYGAEDLTAEPVSTLVNNVRNDTPACLVQETSA